MSGRLDPPDRGETEEREGRTESKERQGQEGDRESLETKDGRVREETRDRLARRVAKDPLAQEEWWDKMERGEMKALRGREAFLVSVASKVNLALLVPREKEEIKGLLDRWELWVPRARMVPLVLSDPPAK